MGAIDTLRQIFGAKAEPQIETKEEDLQPVILPERPGVSNELWPTPAKIRPVLPDAQGQWHMPWEREEIPGSLESGPSSDEQLASPKRNLALGPPRAPLKNAFNLADRAAGPTTPSLGLGGPEAAPAKEMGPMAQGRAPMPLPRPSVDSALERARQLDAQQRLLAGMARAGGTIGKAGLKAPDQTPYDRLEAGALAEHTVLGDRARAQEDMKMQRDQEEAAARHDLENRKFGLEERRVASDEMLKRAQAALDAAKARRGMGVGGEKPLSRGQELDLQKLAKDEAAMNGLASNIAVMKEAAATPGDIPGAGRIDASHLPNEVKKLFGSGRPEDIKVLQAATDAGNQLLYLRSGAQINESEMKRVISSYGLGMGTGPMGLGGSEDEFRIGVAKFAEDVERMRQGLRAKYMPQVWDKYLKQGGPDVSARPIGQNQTLQAPAPALEPSPTAESQVAKDGKKYKAVKDANGQTIAWEEVP